MFGVPLYRLLGGASNEVPVYASWNLWWQYDLPTLAQHAQDTVWADRLGRWTMGLWADRVVFHALRPFPRRDMLAAT